MLLLLGQLKCWIHTSSLLHELVLFSCQGFAAGPSVPPRVACAAVVGDAQCSLHDEATLCSKPV